MNKILSWEHHSKYDQKLSKLPFNPMLNANLYRKVDGAFSFTKPFDLPVNLMMLVTGQDEFLLIQF